MVGIRWWESDGGRGGCYGEWPHRCLFVPYDLLSADCLEKVTSGGKWYSLMERNTMTDTRASMLSQRSGLLTISHTLPRMAVNSPPIPSVSWQFLYFFLLSGKCRCYAFVSSSDCRCSTENDRTPFRPNSITERTGWDTI